LKSASLTVRTRSNDVKFFPQLLAQGDQASTAGMGAGFQPQDALGRSHGRHQSGQIVSMQFIEHMTDHQRGAGVYPGRIGLCSKTREALPGSAGGKLHGQGGTVVKANLGEGRRPKGIDHATRGHTAATSPV
jgi:hypothetical protein